MGIMHVNIGLEALVWRLWIKFTLTNVCISQPQCCTVSMTTLRNKILYFESNVDFLPPLSNLEIF